MNKFRITDNWLQKAMFNDTSNCTHYFEAIKLNGLSKLAAYKLNELDFQEDNFKYYIVVTNKSGSTLQLEYDLDEEPEFNQDLTILKTYL